VVGVRTPPRCPDSGACDPRAGAARGGRAAGDFDGKVANKEERAAGRRLTTAAPPGVRGPTRFRQTYQTIRLRIYSETVVRAPAKSGGSGTRGVLVNSEYLTKPGRATALSRL